MAVRRTAGDREMEDYGDQPEDPNPFHSMGGGRVDEFGNVLPDFANDPNYPVPFQDYQPTEIAGDQTTARELFNQPRAPQGIPRPDQTGGLPQGMTVQSEEGYGGGGDMPAFSTPSTPHEPTPMSGMPPRPDVTRRVSSPGAQSALFSEASGGTPLFGRAGGLMGGGKGVLGANEGGPTPTEMMLSLLRTLRNGA